MSMYLSTEFYSTTLTSGEQRSVALKLMNAYENVFPLDRYESSLNGFTTLLHCVSGFHV